MMGNGKRKKYREKTRMKKRVEISKGLGSNCLYPNAKGGLDEGWMVMLLD
jgi:hypothetical protein